MPTATSMPMGRTSPPPNVMAVDPTIEAPVATPEPTATSPAETSASSLGQVVLVKEEDRAQGLAKAMVLLEAESLLGRDVLLKPNFNSADPSPGSTHPDILYALLKHLQALDAGRITLVDRSGMGNTREVMEQIGVFELIDAFDCSPVILDDLPEDEWVIYRQPGQHWQDGFPVPRLLLDADAIVQTCNLKTHRYGGHFTMSLKNSVGFVAKRMRSSGHDYMTELHNSPYQRLMIAEINAAYEPNLVVMDGIEAFVSGGPDKGQRVKPGVILAGRDRVAIDAVGVAILRMFGTTPEVSQGRVFEQEQISQAVNLGLGVTEPEQIEFITGDSKSQQFAEQLQEILVS